MGNLSPNFNRSEFEIDAPIPDPCIMVLTSLCMNVLEPIREQFNAEMKITSGYRPPTANAEAHGQPNSEHIYTPRWAAADFEMEGVDSQTIFDWARNNPKLPFHQLILEHGQNSTIVHVSVNLGMIGTRSVLVGATHNAAQYIHVSYVPYNPTEQVQTT